MAEQGEQSASEVPEAGKGGQAPSLPGVDPGWLSCTEQVGSVAENALEMQQSEMTSWCSGSNPDHTLNGVGKRWAVAPWEESLSWTLFPGRRREAQLCT